MRIIIILNQPPSAAGYGGNHRSYQIVHDLRSIPNTELIIILDKDIQKEQNSPSKYKYSFRNYLLETKDRLTLVLNLIRFGGNRFRILRNSIEHYSHSNFNFSLDEDKYCSLLIKNSPIDICMVDHAKYLSVAEINSRYGISTWLIPHNLETYDNYALVDYRNENSERFLLSLHQELKTLSLCQYIFPISRVETWFLNGLDLPAFTYPYFPVGEVRDALLDVRKKRKEQNIDQGLILLVGTFVHRTTGQSIKWFLENLKQNGLPTGCRLKVIGKGSEVLKENYQDIPGVEILGWVETEVLLQLISVAKALLVPQFAGFGAVTRISEAACAGIPVLVSEHAVQSIDPPPGIIPLPDNWKAWQNAIVAIMASNNTVVPDQETYTTWEDNQSKPLTNYIDLASRD